MELHDWVLLLHLLGAFLFVGGHGVSAFMAFRLRSERDPARLAALLDFSAWSLAGTGPMSIGFLVMLLSGIWAGFVGNYWGDAWIWTAIVLLIAIVGSMTPLGAIHYNKVRHALGMRTPREKKDAPLPTPASPAELEALLTANTPWILSGIGGIGLAVVVWLMVAKPF